MDRIVSFGNVSSGAFFSDDISCDSESVIQNLLSGIIPEKVLSSIDCKEKPSDHQTPKRDMKSKLLKYGHELVISESLEKLDILRLIMREKVDPKWYDDIHYRPSHKRFHADAHQMDDDDYNLYEYTNTRKISKNVCMLHNILRKSLIELETTQSCDTFQKAVNILEQESYDEINFRYEFEDNRILLNSLLEDIEDSHDMETQKYEKKASELYRIQQEYEDLVLFSELKIKYINTWEDNRYYLNALASDKKEKELSNLIEEYKRKIELDDRCHLEIRDFMEVSTIYQQDQIEYWMAQYDEMVDKIDGDIYAMRVTREKVASDLNQLNREYKFRAQEIILWLEYKEELRKKMELEEILRKAATKIQAWWRGTMVRHKLGPYGKRKKGKKGKGKKMAKKLNRKR